MSRAWAAEYSPSGVRVNTVAPGPVYTNAARRGLLQRPGCHHLARPGGSAGRNRRRDRFPGVRQGQLHHRRTDPRRRRTHRDLSRRQTWKGLTMTETYVPSATDLVADQVARYEASDGADSGTLEGRPVVILTTTGARTGRHPQEPGDAYSLRRQLHCGGIERRRGQPIPAWYRNLTAHPDVWVQDGAVKGRFRAREVFGDEKTQAWADCRAVLAALPRISRQGRALARFPSWCSERIEDEAAMTTGAKQSARERLLGGGRRTLLRRRRADGRHRPGHRARGGGEGLAVQHLRQQREPGPGLPRGPPPGDRGPAAARHRTAHRSRARLLAVFDAQAEIFADPNFHGCAFIARQRRSA